MKTLFTIVLSLVLIGVGGIALKTMNVSAVSDHSTDMAGSAMRKAIFAGGCFWCMEKPFEELDGVISVVSGYSGGTPPDPTYDNYARGGYIEVVEITFDPQKVSYRELLDVYWRQVDPTDPDGQFVDRGHAYTTAIFYFDEVQQLQAEESKKALAESGIFSKPIVTPILPAAKFYPAEAYHQDYYKKNPIRYKFYRSRSGRDVFLKKVWGKEKDQAKNTGELRQRLTPLQYSVTQEAGTEPPFNNMYWNNKKPGIYVDIVSNEPLFSSLDKYDSGTGWPNFTTPLEKENIVEIDDRMLFVVRTEVRSRNGNSHLGHVFDDSPPPTGMRYCINSAALRYIPLEKLRDGGVREIHRTF